MKQSKLTIIQAKDESELIKLVNESKEDYFATQPIQKIDGSWVMFCYSKKDNKLDNEKHPDEREATKKQLFYLKKNKIPIKENLTKKEAFELIKKHKEKK